MQVFRNRHHPLGTSYGTRQQSWANLVVHFPAKRCPLFGLLEGSPPHEVNLLAITALLLCSDRDGSQLLHHPHPIKSPMFHDLALCKAKYIATYKNQGLSCRGTTCMRCRVGPMTEHTPEDQIVLSDEVLRRRASTKRRRSHPARLAARNSVVT
jgi:hypothetical protein